MGMGGSATYPSLPPQLDLTYLAPPAISRSSLPRITIPPMLARIKVTFFISAWFVFSLASLFQAKHVLHTQPVSETQLTLSLFLCSVIFGLIFTKVLRLHSLEPLNRQQLRAVVPLSLAFLIKEVLKYASLARVSVNLVNTIRSLGPLFNVMLEFIIFRHRPSPSILWALSPIIIGVALTTIDEIHSASLSSSSFFVAVAGFFAAVVSTAINNAQNIYSKVLFGKERIDPVSLQIYLSAISLALMSPPAVVNLTIQFFKRSSNAHLQLLPPMSAAGPVLLIGFVNFVASQLAFNTLNLISPLSYSVANTFKRVCIAIIAIFYFSERLSLVNGVGILVSIGGLFIYERKARALKEARAYRKSDNPAPSPATSTQSEHNTTPQAGSLPARKHTTSGPDLQRLAEPRIARLDARRPPVPQSVTVDTPPPPPPPPRMLPEVAPSTTPPSRYEVAHPTHIIV